MTWIQTLDGAAFDLLEPDSRKINPETIAVCLARTCRFKGHCREFYSVAQHSVIVCDMMTSQSLRLPALLHDAHEIYDGFGDITRPAKLLNNNVRAFLKQHAKLVNVAIAGRFGFNPEMFYHPQIEQADSCALATEQRDVMGHCDRNWEEMPAHSPIIRIEPVGIDEAYRMFIARLYELWNE